MARQMRIHQPGALYHIMLRGNNGQDIFFSAKDYCKFALLLQEVKERFKLSIHGFCFMTNHVHLVIQVSECSISDAIQNLALRYSQYINRKENRVGHLFQDRFKSILVEERQYLLQLVRYVHLNPVRANMVSNPADYPWSGHSTFLGERAFTWLTTNLVLSKFDPYESVARECYERYVNYKDLSDIDFVKFEKGSHEGGFLGSDEFVENYQKETVNFNANSTHINLNELIENICEFLKIPSSSLTSQGKERQGSMGRSFAAYFVKRTAGLTLKELADFVGRDISCLSKQAHSLEIKAINDGSLANQISELTQRIANNPR
jgi:putative transposase